ncbi:hypothetical protein [Acinetobacter sp. A3]|uniref:hypothetical protein n=1 Tax=Acinetobacter sp. A3 TaxID=2725492 RepID=UPI001444A681|nr:hypothetical protein [Acinetobacter sp. A3]
MARVALGGAHHSRQSKFGLVHSINSEFLIYSVLSSKKVTSKNTWGVNMVWIFLMVLIAMTIIFFIKNQNRKYSKPKILKSSKRSKNFRW